jgi:hypothetical protein
MRFYPMSSVRCDLIKGWPGTRLHRAMTHVCVGLFDK